MKDNAMNVQRDYDLAGPILRLCLWLLLFAFVMLLAFPQRAEAQNCFSRESSIDATTALDATDSILVVDAACPGTSADYKPATLASMLLLTGRVTTHATDCTGTTAIAPAICYERDADTIYLCDQAAGTACDAAGEWTEIAGGGGGGTPGGSDTQLQFNDGGSFGGAAGLTWDASNSALFLEGPYLAPFFASFDFPDDDWLDFDGQAPRIFDEGNVAATFAEDATTLSQLLKLVPQATAPASCAIGDIYIDTSGAACACSATNTWTNMHGVGSCA